MTVTPILYANIRSVRTNREFLNLTVEKKDPQVIALFETWQKPQDSPISLKHDFYNALETRRIARKKGGSLAILVDKYLQAFDYSPFQSEYVLTVKILSHGHKGGHLFIVLFAPLSEHVKPLEDLKATMDYLLKRYKDPAIFIVGDFNLLEEDGKIRLLKEDYGLSGLINHDVVYQESASVPTTKTRRIDYLLVRGTSVVS